MSPIIRGSNDMPPQNPNFNQPGNQQGPFYPQPENQPQYPPQNPQYNGQQQYPPQYMPQNMDPGFVRNDRPKGTWQATGPQMNDMQAHRDIKYQLANPIVQTFTVFKTQMSLFSKKKIIYILLFTAVLIPIIYSLIKDRMSFNNMTELSGNGMMGLMLFLFPLILGLFTSFLCASLMPSEINERTAYMNMALPMSRSSFCLGKYLASMVITLGVFIFAYGMAMLTANTDYAYFDESGLGRSFILLILAVLVYTSFSFAIGCFLKRGATIVSLLTLVAAIPGIQTYLFMDKQIDSVALTLFPNLLPDMTCLDLGSRLTASPIGLINLMFSDGGNAINIAEMDIAMTALVAIIWTVVFLALGIFAVSRREM